MIPLHDCQCGFGGTAPGVLGEIPLAELVENIERLAIGGALVRTLPDELNRDTTVCNKLLYDACATDPRLVPCPVLKPDATEHEAGVAEALRCGARAVFLRPPCDHWSLDEWCSAGFLGALEDRRLPAFVLQRDVSLGEAADVAGRHQHLPIILAGVSYRSQRELVPILRARPNIVLSIGTNYSVHFGLEQLVGTVGPERLLFGTGFPDVVPDMAVSMLMYAEIADEQKAMIGAEDLQRLIAEVAI